MFPSDLTPDDIVRARRKAMQEEAMLKAMQEGQTASTAETPAELRAAMGDIAAQFAAQEARSSSAPAPLLLRDARSHVVNTSDRNGCNLLNGLGLGLGVY